MARQERGRGKQMQIQEGGIDTRDAESYKFIKDYKDGSIMVHYKSGMGSPEAVQITGIPPWMTEGRMLSIAWRHGRVKGINIYRHPNLRLEGTGILQFASAEGAASFREEMDQHQFEGEHHWKFEVNVSDREFLFDKGIEKWRNALRFQVTNRGFGPRCDAQARWEELVTSRDVVVHTPWCSHPKPKDTDLVMLVFGGEWKANRGNLKFGSRSDVFFEGREGRGRR